MEKQCIHFILVEDVLNNMSSKMFVEKSEFEKFVYEAIKLALSAKVRVYHYWGDDILAAFAPTAIFPYFDDETTVEEILATTPDVPDEERALKLDLNSIDEEIKTLRDICEKTAWYWIFKRISLEDDISSMERQLISMEDFLNKSLYWYLYLGFGTAEDFRAIHE